MISTQRLSEVFVAMADTLVDDFDVVDFLGRVTTYAAELSQADSAGLLLSDQRGRLQFMAASDPTMRDLELFQLQNQDGPCLDCFTTGDPVVNADLAHAEDKWPRFAPRAAAMGYISVHAFPMKLRGQVLGALGLFTASDARLKADEVHVVQALADVATIGILQERTLSRAEALTEQLQGALTSRIVIEQAKGAVAQMAGITVEEAFDLLRGRARSTQTRLTDVARAVLDGTQPPFRRDQR